MATSRTGRGRRNARPATSLWKFTTPKGGPLRGVSRLLDVSKNGACVESTCEFNEGDGLVLRGSVGDGEVVPFRAVVIWRSFSFRLHRYGLRFDDLSPAARESVDRFVSLTAARWRKKR
ncbi:MAG: PilZ domain-containing protein [Elusimicrobia bacterium]|nr:PilZ domain-containing protein [Elusimicrobiota bacterium]